MEGRFFSLASTLASRLSSMLVRMTGKYERQSFFFLLSAGVLMTFSRDSTHHGLNLVFILNCDLQHAKGSQKRLDETTCSFFDPATRLSRPKSAVHCRSRRTVSKSRGRKCNAQGRNQEAQSNSRLSGFDGPAQPRDGFSPFLSFFRILGLTIS